VVDQNQRKQAVNFRLIGHQRGEPTAQPDRLAGQVDVARVALVVDQVDDRQHRVQAVGQQVIGWHRERNPGRLDLRLRTRQAPLHRLLRHQERARDLLRRQPTERPQRERHLRLERQRGMTAREDQLKPLVLDCGVVQLVLRCLRHLEQPGLFA
jgi:hypothetical protein